MLVFVAPTIARRLSVLLLRRVPISLSFPLRYPAEVGRPLSIIFLLYPSFRILHPMFSSRLLSSLFPLYPRHRSSPFARDRSSLSRVQRKLSVLPRSAPAASPRASLFCANRHPWWPTQFQPRRNRSSNVVHLAPRRLAVLNSSLFHLP